MSRKPRPGPPGSEGSSRGHTGDVAGSIGARRVELLVVRAGSTVHGPGASAPWRCVAEAVVLEVVVRDLHTASGRKGSQVMSLPAFQRFMAPGARPEACASAQPAHGWPSRLAPVRLDLVDQLASPSDAEPRRHAHVVEGASVVVEPQQKRPDASTVLVRTEPCHDAVSGPLVLDLQHDPLVGQVVQVGGLGHYAVEPAPSKRENQSRRRRDPAWRASGAREAEAFFSNFSRVLRPCHVRRLHVRGVVVGQEVEGDEGGGRGLGQLPDSLLGRVDPLGQGIEIEAPGTDDNHLAVEDAPGRQLPTRGLDQFGEVTGQRLLVATAQLYLVSVLENDAAKAVPFRFVVQAVVAGRSRVSLANMGETGGTTGRESARSGLAALAGTTAPAGTAGRRRHHGTPPTPRLGRPTPRFTIRLDGTSAVTAFGSHGPAIPTVPAHGRPCRWRTSTRNRPPGAAGPREGPGARAES